MSELSNQTPEQREVIARALGSYLPAWCARQAPQLDASRVKIDWAFLTPEVAHWFVTAVDERVVDVSDGSPRLADRRRTYLFQRVGGTPYLEREGFLEVAAAGLLAERFGWHSEQMQFQSPRRGKSLWAFDLLAYSDRAADEVAIAIEVKYKQSDAAKLAAGLEACCARGSHHEGDCDQDQNHHRKYQGLLDHRPRVLWIVGPAAFVDDPRLVFVVRRTEDYGLDLEPTEAIALTNPLLREASRNAGGPGWSAVSPCS